MKAQPAAALPREALRGLKPAQAQQLQRALGLLQSGERTLAGLLLLDLARSAPDHPEVLRARGVRHAQEAEWPQAADCLARASAQRPQDLPLLLQLARAQDESNDHVALARTMVAAETLARSGKDWFALSTEHDRAGHMHAAHACAERALAVAPDAAVARLQRARCATALGFGAQAAADCRHLIGRNELLARAWFMLADLKVERLTAGELTLLEATAVAPPATMPSEERLYLLFALGKALEDDGRHAAAFDALCRANTAASATRPWDAAAFQHTVDAVQAAFAGAAPAPEGAAPGREVIFLVGLPRSGTTLTEQILGSHARVEGASELPYLPRIIDAESRRRGKPYPHWVADASDADWARMGQEYLRLSARWRASKPIATDKLPDNWLYAPAALRMLPGARVVDCRRDPVETCWSCYKQLFGPGMVHFTYRFDDLAAYWRAYDGLCSWLARQLPGRFIVQRYEALVAEPEAQIRALLAACALDFDPACLQFHAAQRAIRTPSALQVRRPLVRTSTPGAGYGALLDPLRALFAPPAPVSTPGSP